MANPTPPIRLFVKPRAGLNVRFEAPPHNQIPSYGAAVPDEHYWHRRLKAKDVELTTEAEIAAGAAAEAAALATAAADSEE